MWTRLPLSAVPLLLLGYSEPGDGECCSTVRSYVECTLDNPSSRASIKSPYAIKRQLAISRAVVLAKNSNIRILTVSWVTMPNTLRKQHVQPFLLLEQEQKTEAAEEEAEAEIAKCSFRLVNKIGQGGYGSVYLVQKNQGLDREAFYAMKVRIWFYPEGGHFSFIEVLIRWWYV